MKVKVKKLEELSKVELSVVFSKEEYDAEYEKQFALELEKIEVPGFRKGKYPRSMYMKKFGDQAIHGKTIDELINKSYYEAVMSKKVNVVGQPEISLLEKCKKDEWGYKAVVAVFPEVVAKDYFGIEAKKEEAVVTDEDLENEVNRNLKMKADLEVVEQAIELGNTAVFDFCGSVDGVEFEGGKAENYSLEIGSGQFIPGFEDQMVGMKAGEEKVVKVKFPENYQAKDLAGKDADFKVLVHEVKKLVLPELNDEYVAELKLEGVNTVEEWKAFLKENLMTEKKEACQNTFEDLVFNKLLENNPVVIPDELVEREVEKKVKQLENTANNYQIPLDLFLKYQGIESVEQYKELVTPGVKTNIHYEVVIYSVMKQEKIKLEKEDYEKYYAQMAKNSSVKEIKEKYPKAAVKEYFMMLKAHDLVLANVK